VYSVNIRSGLTPNTSIRATYARGFRAPSLKELYLDFVDINHNLHGNPELEAESSHNFNLNFSYQRETKHTYFNNELGVFYNLVDNMIWLFQVGNDITNYTYGNVSKFISTGVQASTTISFYPTLTLRAGISYVGRKFPENSESGNSNFRYSTDVNAMATYKLNKPGVSFTANYKYTGRFPQLSPDGQFQDQYIEGYSNLDVNVVKFLFKDKLSVAAGGKNLLDVKDVKAGMVNSGAHTSSDGASRIAWGRSYFVKLTYNFTRF
jgi:outer membrane receptor for ferrienterochelin and colicins